MLFVGFDPGLSGAYAVIDENKKVLSSGNLPIYSITVEGKSSSSIVTRQLDGRALVELLQGIEGTYCAAAVERIVVFPSISKTACLSLGDSAAVCRMACQMIRCENVYQPTAAFWKSALGVPKAPKGQPKEVKKLSAQFARDSFPDLPKVFRHDKMEALLLAEYARSKFLKAAESVST